MYDVVDDPSIVVSKKAKTKTWASLWKQSTPDSYFICKDPSYLKLRHLLVRGEKPRHRAKKSRFAGWGAILVYLVLLLALALRSVNWGWVARNVNWGLNVQVPKMQLGDLACRWFRVCD